MSKLIMLISMILMILFSVPAYSLSPGDIEDNSFFCLSLNGILPAAKELDKWSNQKLSEGEDEKDQQVVLREIMAESIAAGQCVFLQGMADPVKLKKLEWMGDQVEVWSVTPWDKNGPVLYVGFRSKSRRA